MFPIINLGSQLEVVNNYIARFQLNKEAIYGWLAYYGELVKPHEESKLRGYPLLISAENEETKRRFREIAEFQLKAYRQGKYTKNKKNRKIEWEQIRSGYGWHIYRTPFGFLNVFHL